MTLVAAEPLLVCWSRKVENFHVRCGFLLCRCGSPVERAFADGSQLSDPDLTALIRASLRDIRPYRLAKQRAAAQTNAEQAVASASAAAAGEGSGGQFGHSNSSFDDIVNSNSMLASLDLIGRYAPGSPQSSMHLGTEAMPTDAQENAGTAAAAAIAVAAAAAASQGGACSFAASPSWDLTPFTMEGTPAHSSSSGSSSSGDGVYSSNSYQEDSPEQKYVRMTVTGAAGLARAAFKARHMRSFFHLASELLASQRVAIAMAVLDNVLRIGEHRVAVGPVCEINVPASSNGSNGVAATAALALLAAVPTVVSQRLIDTAVGAAADMAAGGKSRQTVLHLADTVLALATIQQEVQLQNHHQQQQSAPAAAAAATAPASGHKLEQAAAVMHCALGDPHSCVTAEELAAAAGGGSSANSVTPKWQLMVTLVGLHVTLLRDLGQLWWAYHTGVALHLRGYARP